MIFAKEDVNTGRQLGMEFTVATTVIAGVCILLASILLVRVKPFSDMKV